MAIARGHVIVLNIRALLLLARSRIGEIGTEGRTPQGRSH